MVYNSADGVLILAGTNLYEGEEEKHRGDYDGSNAFLDFVYVLDGWLSCCGAIFQILAAEKSEKMGRWCVLIYCNLKDLSVHRIDRKLHCSRSASCLAFSPIPGCSTSSLSPASLMSSSRRPLGPPQRLPFVNV